MIDSIAYEELTPDNQQTDIVIFHIHGGGFKVALNNFYRHTAEKYSKLFGNATVFSVDYGTWPANELPSQMYDTVKIYLHLISVGFSPEKIVFIGDSAGANLALTSCLYLRDNGKPLPHHIVCFSLWGDADSTGESRIKNAYTDPFYGIAKRKRIEDNLHLLRRISAYVQNAENEIAEIAMEIVNHVLPQHFIDVPTLILPLVRKALLKVKDQSEVHVRVAPESYDLVLMGRSEFQGLLEGQALLEVHSDQSLTVGDVVIETPNGNVDARLSTQIEMIRKSIQDAIK